MTKPRIAEQDDEIDYATPEALASYDADTAREVVERVRELRAMDAHVDETGEIHKAAKKNREKAGELFMEWTRKRGEQRGRKPQPELYAEGEE